MRGLGNRKTDSTTMKTIAEPYLLAFVNFYRTAINVNRLLIVIAALLYVIDPIDMVPDFIIGGFLDDVTVIGWAITKVAQELEDYKLHRPSNFDYLE